MFKFSLLQIPALGKADVRQFEQTKAGYLILKRYEENRFSN